MDVGASRQPHCHSTLTGRLRHRSGYITSHCARSSLTEFPRPLQLPRFTQSYSDSFCRLRARLDPASASHHHLTAKDQPHLPKRKGAPALLQIIHLPHFHRQAGASQIPLPQKRVHSASTALHPVADGVPRLKSSTHLADYSTPYRHLPAPLLALHLTTAGQRPPHTQPHRSEPKRLVPP